MANTLADEIEQVTSNVTTRNATKFLRRVTSLPSWLNADGCLSQRSVLFNDGVTYFKLSFQFEPCQASFTRHEHVAPTDKRTTKKHPSSTRCFYENGVLVVDDPVFCYEGDPVSGSAFNAIRRVLLDNWNGLYASLWK